MLSMFNWTELYYHSCQLAYGFSDAVQIVVPTTAHCQQRLPPAISTGMTPFRSVVLESTSLLIGLDCQRPSTAIHGRDIISKAAPKADTLLILEYGCLGGGGPAPPALWRQLVFSSAFLEIDKFSNLA